jgi:cbb3-type cytochrome oxidase subunit 3
VPTDLVDAFGSLAPVWLMLTFLGIVVWTFWPKRKKEVEAMARIPLEEDRQS